MIYDNNKDNPIRQCDIFESIHFSCVNESFHSIILNPDCDLVIQKGKKKPKADFVKLASIVPFDHVLESLFSMQKISKSQRAGVESIDGGTFEDCVKIIKSFIRGDIFTRYYYLPPYTGFFSHSIIDYQMLEIIPFNNETAALLKEGKITGIKSSWRESIPVRYSNYSSRIGLEDITDACIDSILTDYKVNFNRSS